MTVFDIATEAEIRRWDQIYGQIDVTGELYKMDEWVHANPARHKKNYKRFIVNWLAKAQREAEAIETREVIRHEISRQTARNY
jgi:hypothetical protein